MTGGSSRNAWTGEYLSRRSDCPGAAVFALPGVRARGPAGRRHADGPPVLPADHERHRVQRDLESAANRPRADPCAAWVDLRPQRPPAREERPDVCREDPTGGPAERPAG